MSNQPTNREELYERIRASSKTEVILEEMVRLGFWPAKAPLPQDPQEEQTLREQLEKEYRAMGTEISRLRNFETMKKELRRRRMEESRKKRQETKERRLREKDEKARLWEKRRETEILYLGTGVSLGLNNLESDPEKLKAAGLPVFESPLKLAEAMGLSVGQLRFLAYHKEVSQTSHYIRFRIPKRNGKFREISAPMPYLKGVQHWILENILYKLESSPQAHGFVPGRSILTNANPHVNKNIVVNIDLKDFFPSITFKRVKGLFRSLGYSEALAIILGLLCTELPARQVQMGDKQYYVASGERRLPQGAPTSPAITNLICRRLDSRLKALAEEQNCTYTRYADDITFSAAGDCNPGNIITRTEYIARGESFTVNKEKTKILRKRARREVTGIVVNEKPNISRRKLKRFKALLFQIEKDGIKGKKWGHSGDIVASIKGFANFVAMVNPAQGEKLSARVKKLFG